MFSSVVETQFLKQTGNESLREDAVLGLVLVSGKDLLEGRSIETYLEQSDHGLIQLMLNCKSDKCRSFLRLGITEQQTWRNGGKS